MMLLTSLHSGFGIRDLSSILFRTGLGKNTYSVGLALNQTLK